MRIIIAGAGEGGFHLAKLLSFESQDITLIDIDKDRLNNAENQLDIKVIKGNSCSLSILKQANISDSDLLIAVTAHETTNITVCALSKQLGCKRTIARISSEEYINENADVSFKKLGVDDLISPQSLAAVEIQQLLDQSAFTNSYEFEDGELTLIGAILDGTVPFVGKTVKEAASIFPDVHFMPIAIQRKGTQLTIIPRGDTEFNEGDQVYFITLKEGVSEIYKLTGKIKESISDVMILGGGRLGYNVAKDLCKKKFNVTIIEQDKTKALELADKIPDAMVIHGDGRSIELLEEENIDSIDAFISVTEDSETNIMTCLMAKSKKVKKTIALVENMDYFNLSQSIGIDTLINKKLLAANDIFRFVRKGDVVELAKLNNMDAEIVEFNVSENSKVLNKKIVNLNFPREAIIGGVIRNDEGLIVLGDFEIQLGDRVLVCSSPEAVSKVESLFL